MGSGISSKCKNKNKDSKHINRCYELGMVIGRGGFATVFEGHAVCQRKNFSKDVAIKALMINNGNRIAQMVVIQNEIDIMCSLDQPSIIKFYEYFIEPNAAYIVMEYFKGFNLLHHLVKSTRLNEQESATIIKQLAEAVEYLHDVHIVHRDIKLENILLSQDCNGNPLIKLTDFGLAKKYTTDENISEMCGTPIYAAPEMLLRSYCHEIDMWSLGVVLYMLLSGYPPFYEDLSNREKMFQTILIAEYRFHKKKWEHKSDAAKSLIAQLLVVDPKLRLCASDVLANEWIMNNANCIHGANSSRDDANVPKVPPLSDIDVPREVESWYCSYYESALVTSNGYIVGASKVENLSQSNVFEIVQIVENSETQ